MVFVNGMSHREYSSVTGATITPGLIPTPPLVGTDLLGRQTDPTGKIRAGSPPLIPGQGQGTLLA